MNTDSIDEFYEDEDMPGVQKPPEEFQKEGLGWVFKPAAHPIVMRVDRLDTGKETYGIVWVEGSTPGLPKHIHQARANLSSTTGRAGLAKHLAEVAPGIPWREYVEKVCVATLRALEEGEPMQMAGRLVQAARTPDVVETLMVTGKPNLLYGPGGAGKSYIAAGLAVAMHAGVGRFAGLNVRKANVLYLDWEEDVYEFDRRVKEVSAGFGIEPPEIPYRFMNGPFRHNLNSLARMLDQNETEVIIIDSLELAMGTVAEAAGAYDVAAKSFFDALNTLRGRTSLLLDHVSEEARKRTQEANKSYGSIFKQNWVRNSFEIKVGDQNGESTKLLGLWQFKTNRGPGGRKIGMSMDFATENVVSFRSADMREIVEAASDTMPLGDRLSVALAKGARPLEELAAMLGESKQKISAFVSRSPKLVALPNGQVGLAETRPSYLRAVAPGMVDEDDRTPLESF